MNEQQTKELNKLLSSKTQNWNDGLIKGRISYDLFIKDVTDLLFDHFNNVTSDLLLLATNQIIANAVSYANTVIAIAKANSEPVPAVNKHKMLVNLEPYQIAMLVFHNNIIINLDLVETNRAEDTIMYMYDETQGIYIQDTLKNESIIRNVSPNISTQKMSEVMSILRLLCPIKQLTKDNNLIAVNNGIFNYDTKKLILHTPEYVFISKSHVNYIENATNPIIKMPDNVDWDVESWVNELSDDDEVVQLIWQMLSAIIRPNVAWNKAIFLYSTIGNNGKGTLCTLMRNICGPNTHVSLPLSNMGEDFALEPLIRSSAIIVDENDVNTYIDKASNMKSIITGDVLRVNRKYKSQLSFVFRGLMVQCLNEFPKTKDKSNSIYRRYLFVPMEKKFEGVERKYIKNDYLHRSDVLEYVLFKILNSNFDEFIIPEVSKQVLDEHKLVNDPIHAFLSEFFEKNQELGDLSLTTKVVYEDYKAWLLENNPSGQLLSKMQFQKQLQPILEIYGYEYKMLSKNAVVYNGVYAPSITLSKQTRGFKKKTD